MTKVLKARFVHVDGRAAEINYYDKDSSDSEKVGNNSNNQAANITPNMILGKELDAKALEAEMILADARSHAKEILLDASEQAKTIMEQARARGYEEGQRGGFDSAHMEMGESIIEISALLRSLEEQKAGMLKNYEGKIRDLAINIAKKVIQAELDRNSEVFLSIYKSAVQELHDQEWIKLSVSDLQVQFATENADMLMSLVKGAKHIEIVSLPEAPAGTCIVETAYGIVDASLDTQMDKIKEAFAGVEMLFEPMLDEENNSRQNEGRKIDL